MSKSKSTTKSKSTKSVNFKNLSVPELEKIYENLRYEWLETTSTINDLNNKINPLVEKQKKLWSDSTVICTQINIKSDKSDDNTKKKEEKKKIMSKSVKTKSKDTKKEDKKVTKKKSNKEKTKKTSAKNEEDEVERR